MKFKLILFVLLIGLTPFNANAYTTGNDLYAQLTSSNTSSNLEAYAYINGVIDTEDLYFASENFKLAITNMNLPESKQKKFTFEHICFGTNGNITYKQVIDIIIKYISLHPETRNHRANALIRRALLETFPCAYNP